MQTSDEDFNAGTLSSVAVGNNEMHLIGEWTDADGVGQESIIISSGDAYFTSPSLCLDSSGNPHIAWMGDYKIYYLYWNGSSWVDADGVGQESISISNNNGYYPSLRLDNSGNPHLAWCGVIASNNYGISYLYWNGSSWVDADGTGQEATSILEGHSFLCEPALCLDSSGNPHITGYASYLKWNGSSWVDVDGTGQESINIPAINPSLFLDGSGNPHIAWSKISSGNCEICYLKWDGSSWVDADGTGQESIKISTAYEYNYVSFCLDGNNKPHIAEQGDISRYYIRYFQWTGFSQGYFLSRIKNAGSIADWGNIYWSSSLPAGTDITLQSRTGNTLTPDDYWSSWSSSYTVSGDTITSLSARYIQCKVNFITTISTQTPSLYDFSITYNCSPSTFAIVSPQEEWIAATNLVFLWAEFYDVDGDTQTALQVQLRYSTGTYGDGNAKDTGEMLSSTNTWTPTDWNLTSGSTYYWRVKVKDNSGFDNCWSEWSEETKFMVDLSSPTGKSGIPADIGADADSSSIKFTWAVGTVADAESGIGGYWLQVSTSPDESGNYKYNGNMGDVLE
ncbi:MAG: hypothetical protein CVU78_04525 [Elusimicrobia bacterium HGW-Elusimicrobia-2]|nr:MAG: hypothetical protein CVU78_04525 [Elusimicrobia bacterium HGW-Elusimicrobia-2]